jgi:hypothetical protein
MSDQTIARNILEQLGGNKAKVMIGIRSMVAHPDGFSFGWKCRGAKNRATNCWITLTPADTYTVEFFRTWRGNVTSVGKFEDIYNDSLITLFERETGLDLRL